jgi:large subunit ribosomal protein L23
MDIIIKPIITEKYTAMQDELSRFGFVVNGNANRLQIKQAIESRYGVKVEKVNTQHYIGKLKTRNTKAGVVNGVVNRHKKAIVTLTKGETIDFYSNI